MKLEMNERTRRKWEKWAENADEDELEDEYARLSESKQRAWKPPNERDLKSLKRWRYLGGRLSIIEREIEKREGVEEVEK